MKKIILKITVVVLMAGILLPSCTKNFTEINTDPNNSRQAVPGQLMAPALVNMLSTNLLRNRNFNNELMQVTVDISDADGKVFRYDFRASWADNTYNNWYAELSNFKEMYRIANERLTLSPTYQAIALILQTWTYSLLTDTYGDVPYFKSNLAKDSANIQPPFDRQKDIYLDMFKQLDTANAILSRTNFTTYPLAPNGDPVFYGDAGRWRRFGNSLFLRLLLRVSGKAEVSQMAIDKFKEIVGNASKYPLISKTDESAILRWTGQGPYASPLLNVREQDFRAPAMGEFFINNLTSWSDPRIDISLGGGTFNRWRIAPSSGAYIGVPSGYIPGETPVKRSYFLSNNPASNLTLMNEPLTGMMMTYAEVQFILAEAAAKDWIPGTDSVYYNNGARGSIQQWLPTWNKDITTSYLTPADMNWEESATLDQKMELIHLQKYYALFLNDFQQWFEYRRTGHPNLPKGPGLRNNGVMPARMTYPVYVQSTNPANYRDAVAAQGPDVISTQVWWQKP